MYVCFGYLSRLYQKCNQCYLLVQLIYGVNIVINIGSDDVKAFIFFNNKPCDLNRFATDDSSTKATLLHSCPQLTIHYEYVKNL